MSIAINNNLPVLSNEGGLSAYLEQIKKFRILPRPLTIEDKELTPTLKVKRNIVQTNWAELIDQMYAED